MKKGVNREYESVMATLREVIMHQYEQSPNATAYLRAIGVDSSVDPLQRLSEVCTPNSLDHACSIYEAYRSMVSQVLKEGERE